MFPSSSNRKPNVGDIIFSLHELSQDNTVPRNVKLKIADILKILNENTDLKIRVSKAQNGLDDIAEDVNLQMHTRTQLFGIVASLEKLA